MPVLELTPEVEQLAPSPCDEMAPRRVTMVRQATHGRLQIAAACLLATVGFVCGEKIEVNGGLGYDGVTYAAMAKDFYRETCELPIDAYRVQRVVPSAVVHYGLRAVGVELSEANIIRGFGALNIICITLMAWCWTRVARHLKLSPGGQWLGWCGLFLSFAVAKHAAYYPILTDIPAMALSAAMLCCYLESRRILLVGLTIVGAFTWPTLILQATLLLMFPYEANWDRRPQPAPRRLNLWFAALAAYYLAVALAWMLRRVPGAAFTGITPIRSVAWLSIATAACYLFWVQLRPLDCHRLFDLRDLLRPSRWLNWAIAITTLVGIKLVQGHWATKPTIMGVQTYALITGIEAVAKPGVFFLAHVVYFGPLVILAALLWKPTCRALHEHGVGLTLAVALGLTNSLDPESRHVITLVPLLFPFVVKATEARRWSARQYALLAAMCVAFSKCWFTINAGPMVGNAFEWPDQRYMMNVGPYLGGEMYLLQGGLALLATGVIYFVCLRRGSSRWDAGIAA